MIPSALEADIRQSLDQIEVVVGVRPYGAPTRSEG
jgi:hypothetical protein